MKLAAIVSSAGAVSLAKGAKVTTLSAGVYRVVVRDRAAGANFHLTGPGVDRKTSITRKSSTTWRVTLKSGRYTYQSDTTPKARRTVVVKMS